MRDSIRVAKPQGRVFRWDVTANWRVNEVLGFGLFYVWDNVSTHAREKLNNMNRHAGTQGCNLFLRIPNWLAAVLGTNVAWGFATQDFIERKTDRVNRIVDQARSVAGDVDEDQHSPEAYRDYINRRMELCDRSHRDV